MIPRILVPKNISRPAAESGLPPRRLSSTLDARKLVPLDLPQFELDPRTAIPAHFPLGVLASRIVVPRDMPVTPLDITSKTPDYVPLTILDSRVAVPKGAQFFQVAPKGLVAIQDLPEVIDSNVLTTGEVNLMTRHVEEGTSAWNSVARVVSIGFHVVVILYILLEPKIFPSRQPTESEIARQNVNYLYSPPSLGEVPRIPVRPQPSSPRVRVDPRLLRQLAPPHEVQPPPGAPEPERVVRDAPAPVRPAPSAASNPMAQPRSQSVQQSPIQPPQPETPATGLVLPRISPGKALQENLHEAMKEGGTSSAQFGGALPRTQAQGGAGSGLGGGGGGQSYLGGNVELLTPTEGVDFSNYLARVLASVKRNWYAVIPESARLGEKGRVVLQFRIMRNGAVPDAEPSFAATSGKEPLDRAALSSIRASTPFEPLPPAFSGPYIELRFIFLYNLPLSAQ